MLKLDPFSENVLFQCDRCRFVGELIVNIIEEDGHYYCWSCLNELNQQSKEERRKRYAIS